MRFHHPDALAVERGTPGMPTTTGLTPEGERKFKKAARNLSGRSAPRRFSLSPYPGPANCRDAAAAWGRPAPEKMPALVGGSLADLAHALGPYGPSRRSRSSVTSPISGCSPSPGSAPRKG
jgi:hypothetical protein